MSVRFLRGTPAFVHLRRTQTRVRVGERRDFAMALPVSRAAYPAGLRARAGAPSSRGWSRREILSLRRRKPTADGRWRVHIDSGRCSDCEACTRVCGPAALTRSADADCVRYVLNAQACDGCGHCTRVCAENALLIARSEERAEASEAACLPVSSCARCGHRGAGLIGDLCAACRQENRRLGAKGKALR